MAPLLGKLTAHRSDCAALAGKSTLNRLELHEREGNGRYHKIRPDSQAIESLWVDLLLDATDDPLHGHQVRTSTGPLVRPRRSNAWSPGSASAGPERPSGARHRR